MLDVLKEIFDKGSIEKDSSGERVDLHSNTSLAQGLFLQEIFEEVKPTKSLEIGLAYGISAMFILEMHKKYNNKDKAHTIVEPYPWSGIAEYNIEKAGLTNLANYKYETSDNVVPRMYYEGERIQFAYVDTTKVFDVVLTDFYFIDKILDVNGVVIFDDCGGSCPGIQRVARFVASLPHYEVYKTIGKVELTSKRQMAQNAVEKMIDAIPFKDKFFPGISFKSDKARHLDYSCIAFRKKAEDSRNWDYDRPF